MTVDAVAGRDASVAAATLARALRRFAPTSASLGYALFLAVNATVIWGGVFPFLPLGFQTRQIVIAFFLAQSLSFALCLLGHALDVRYGFPRAVHVLLARPTAPYIAGWCVLIAATYVHAAALPLAMLGGVLIGFNTAGFFILWNVAFAAGKKGGASHDLILGTLYAPVIYFSLYLIPVAMTVFLVPTVFAPLFALAIKVDAEHAGVRVDMLDEQVGAGREHAQRYRKVLRDHWRSALCVGTIGFSSGVVRSIAIAEPAAGGIVNAASMAGVFVSALVLFLVWQFKPLRLNVTSLFRAAFPFVLGAFGLMPLFGESYLQLFAGAVYALYGCAILLVMLQCGQTAAMRKVSPVFVCGFFGCIVYAMHDLGFLSGQFASVFVMPGASVVVTTAFVAVFVLALAMYVGQGGIRAALAPGAPQADRVEIMVTDASPATRRRPSAGAAAGHGSDGAGRGSGPADTGEAPAAGPALQAVPARRRALQALRARARGHGHARPRLHRQARGPAAHAHGQHGEHARQTLVRQDRRPQAPGPHRPRGDVRPEGFRAVERDGECDGRVPGRE